MTDFTVFDEEFYLASYPDVAAAVASKTVASGLQHFQAVGQKESRTLVSPYYNEASYLAKYADVAAAVKAGTFKSGLDHFVSFGFNEGRSPRIVFPGSEDIYLQKYADVAAAVKAGTFKSGFDHFLKFGLAEGRSASYLNENDYLLFNPDVAQAVKQKKFKSGYDHLVRFGQFETSRFPLFSGTSGNDNITSFGVNTNITGVAIESLSANPADFRVISTGLGEIDVLTGQATQADFFSIGIGSSPSTPNPIKFYVGQGDADYALIQNLVQGIDSIALAGNPSEYVQRAIDGNLNIFTIQGNRDLVAIVQGVTSPVSVLVQDPTGFFLAG